MTRHRLISDQRGGISLIIAGSLFMLAGAATMAVDLGSVYLARRQLQGMADAAALAAVDGGRPAVIALLARNGATNVSLSSLQSGDYSKDPAVAVNDRFSPGGTGLATQVELRRRTPLFFAKLLVGRDGIDLTARAIAARSNATAFSLSTGLAAVSGGLPNMLLSSLAGTQLDLTVMDTQGLASLDMDLLNVADALRVRLGHDGESYGDLFNREIPLSTLLGAMADAAGSSPTASILLGLSTRLTGRSIRLSDIVDLGPAANAGSSTGQPNIVVDAFTMLRMLLSPPAGTSVPIDFNLTVPGLTTTRLKLILGNGQAHSPMMTVTSSQDVILRTGQARIYLESNVATLLPGIASIHVPLYVELAAAEARLSAMQCDSASPDAGVTLAVTPSIGSVALADVDTGALTNFATVPNPRPALLAQTLLGTRVTGYSNVSLGGAQSQNIHFTPDEIRSDQVKRASTNDLTQAVAASALTNARIQVSLLGVNVSASPLLAPVASLLGTTAPLLDDIINGVTASLGVSLGNADVQVHDLRCGMATLVA
ncbi:putative membrane protein [Sphingobium sp. OAS761]|uniref:pilus assembly protein TadG-related protein n=1 Tax=Sphingobium sp. OAS761 TaxID=2817901 RepID=UPI00209DAB89|nr:pilus assembly protein TadG-related protein [Sphingobium sp. OAS761]MCP1469857.1 putative membrane protein [Sphingobium sp. OAS761]